MAGAPILINQFPDLSVLVAVEIAWGADIHGNEASWVWTDITGDVQYKQKIAIKIGRADEASKPQPADLKITVDNRQGLYSKGPQSSNFPNVKKNTPIRVRVFWDGVWYIRFQGGVLEFSPSWDVTGGFAIVKIVAAGARRRLQQNTQPLLSALRRYIPTNPDVRHYWPLEDGTDSIFAQPAVGDIPLTIYDIINSSETKVVFDDDQGQSPLVTSDGVAGLYGGAGLFIKQAKFNLTSAKWAVIMAYKEGIITDSSTGAGPSGPAIQINGQQGSGLFTISVFYDLVVLAPERAKDVIINGTEVIVGPRPLKNGQWHFLELYFTNNGGTSQDVNFRIDGVDHIITASGAGTMTTVNDLLVFVQSLTLPQPPFVAGASVTAVAQAAHVALLDAGIADVDPGLYGAFLGNADEYVHDRLARLAAENSELITVVGTSEVQCGPQVVDTLLNILDDAAQVDGGILFDGLNRGLTYVCRTARENIEATLILDASLGQIEDPITPIDDDQTIVNNYTASRINGSSYQYTRPDGDHGTSEIGAYTGSANLNFSAGVRQVQDYASWQVHVGTDLSTLYRWPDISLAFHHKPDLIDDWLQMSLLSRIDIINIDSVRTQQPHDTISLLLEGYSETIDQFMWTAALNMSSYDQWRIGELIGSTSDVNPDAIRLESDGSLVTTGCAAGGTSIVVTTATGPRWIDSATYVTEFPFMLDVGGIIVKCTAITGTGTVQTFTLDGTTVHYAIGTGRSVRIAYPGYLGQVKQ